MAIDGDDQDSRLLIVDQENLSAHTLELGEPSPFYVRSIGDLVYVAHTFLNSGFRALSDYRSISVVNSLDETVTTHELPAGVSRFDVNATTLAVIGELADASPILHTYALPDFTPVLTVRLEAPASLTDAYPATLFLPQS
jgi:hypothetical protein